MRILYRALAVASGCALAACSSGTDFFMAAAPPVMTLQFESEPVGAEVKTSTGQTCRTPCALAVPAADLTATYALRGFQPQTIPVKLQPPEVPRENPNPSFTPNPVYAELQPAKPAARRPVAQRPAPGTTAGASTTSAFKTAANTCGLPAATIRPSCSITLAAGDESNSLIEPPAIQDLTGG